MFVLEIGAQRFVVEARKVTVVRPGFAQRGIDLARYLAHQGEPLTERWTELVVRSRGEDVCFRVPGHTAVQTLTHGQFYRLPRLLRPVCARWVRGVVLLGAPFGGEIAVERTAGSGESVRASARTDPAVWIDLAVLALELERPRG